MGRKSNTFESETVTLTLIEPTTRYLERLVATGEYGNNVAEVAKTIVLEKIRVLINDGRLVEMPPMPRLRNKNDPPNERVKDKQQP